MGTVGTEISMNKTHKMRNSIIVQKRRSLYELARELSGWQEM